MAQSATGTLYRGREGMWSWVAHRISGVLIFLFLFAHVLDTALVRVSPEAYNTVMETYKNPIVGLGEAWAIAVAWGSFSTDAFTCVRSPVPWTRLGDISVSI